MREEIRETRLDNGLVVLTDRMPHVRSVTLGFFYRTGARDEPEDLSGITHFIEHTVFKGTRRRSALNIAIEQDRLGGNLEAFTTHEETGFALKVIDDQLDAAFDLMSDMLVNPSFDERELESERRVIIEEMKMTDDNPEEHLGEIFAQALFPGDALGRPIAGTPETVKTFNHEATRTYHEQAFNAGDLVIVAAGNVEHEHIVGLVSAMKFARPGGVADKSAGASSNAAPIVVRQKPDLEQAHLILSAPTVAAADGRRYAADLLTSIIGGGTASRLWQKVREDRGLAYTVGASSAMYRDRGVFTVFAGTSPEHIGEVVDITISELRDVVRNGLTHDELGLAKHQARAGVLLSLEDSAIRAAVMAQTEIVHGRQISIGETLAKIDAITIEDMVELAREFFRTDAIAFAALGDLDGFAIDRSRLAI
jgi:predicted Zn-dependent peptidase